MSLSAPGPGRRVSDKARSHEEAVCVARDGRVDGEERPSETISIKSSEIDRSLAPNYNEDK